MNCTTQLTKITKKEAINRLPTSEWIATWYKAEGGAWVGRKDKRTVIMQVMANTTEFFEPEISFPKISTYPEHAQGNLFQFNDSDGYPVIVAKDPPHDTEVGLLTESSIKNPKS